ncbi:MULTISPECIES: hypothetical protein [unclassified Microbacterium]|uniref:terminase gpP N-terminus-related DNA-binding protein n=1 Tax=unclassified Microbacterium TaxID=2609290 RepID=UPI000C2BFD70|nr:MULTISPECIES: hypothetical protein [unclassified Microbacterium]
MTALDHERAKYLHSQGFSCSGIARSLNVAKSTVSEWAAKEGLSFDRTKTENATRASQVDRAARRSQIIERLYDQVDTVLDRLEQTEDTPARDQRDYSVALTNYLERVTRLELVDGEPGLAQAESMLGRLAEGFGFTMKGEPI